MSKKKLIFVYSALLMILFFLPLLFQTTVKAVDINPNEDFKEDGYDNWVEPKDKNGNFSGNVVGRRKINDKLNLVYTFGLGDGGDKYIISPPDPDAIIGPYSAGAKMNIYFENDGKTAPIFYRTGTSKDIGPDTEYLNALSVANSSPDFGIVFQKDSKLNGLNDPADSSILLYLKDKRFFYTSNSKNEKVVKIMGIYEDLSGHKFEVEIMLEPSKVNDYSVDQRLFIKNISDQKVGYGIYEGEDTFLNGQDDVEIKSLGDDYNKKGSGFYIENYPQPEEPEKTNEKFTRYKMIVNRAFENGPDSYTAKAWSGTDHKSILDKFVSQKFSGEGVENSHIPYKSNIYPWNGRQNPAWQPTAYVDDPSDSSYIFKWNWAELAPNQTKEYKVAVGGTEEGSTIPDIKKNYTNNSAERRDDKANKTGDELTFTVNVINDGFRSNFQNISVKDNLAKGLDIDLNSIEVSKVSDDNISRKYTGFTKNLSNDSNGNTLELKGLSSITDGESFRITYKVKIASGFAGTTLKNSATALGYDQGLKQNRNVGPVSVSIPVKRSANIKAHLNKSVKRDSDPDEAFADSASGRYDDLMDYKIVLKVDQDSDLVPEGQLEDEVTPDSAMEISDISLTTDNPNIPKKNYNSLSDIKTSELNPGESVTIFYKARIMRKEATEIKNIVKIKYTDENNASRSIDSNETVVNVGPIIGLVVPSNIDFGTVTPFNLSDLVNKTTTRDGSNERTMLVSNYTGNDYNIDISYDNNGQGAIKSDNNKLDTTEDAFLYIMSFDNKKFLPITGQETPVHTESGNTIEQDFTSYVGPGKWKIKTKPNFKSGKYSGYVTWNLVQSL